MKIFNNIMFLIITLSMVHAQDKRAITFEDFFAMQRLGNPVVSKDGNYIASPVTIPDIDGNQLSKEIIVMKKNGEKIQRFGSKIGSVKNPYISSDDKFIYFINFY